LLQSLIMCCVSCLQHCERKTAGSVGHS
jgi:hypothetical protein